jgi:hypothetical protein
MLKDNQTLLIRVKSEGPDPQRIVIEFTLTEQVFGETDPEGKRWKETMSQRFEFADGVYPQKPEYILFDIIMTLQFKLSDFIWKYFNGSQYRTLQHDPKMCHNPRGCNHEKHPPFNCPKCNCSYGEW